MRIELFDGLTTVGVDVDPSDLDATVSLLVDDAEVAGIDAANRTVGVWPDGYAWAVVHRFGPATSGVSPASTPVPPTDAERAFALLSPRRRGRLLRRVFETLE